MSNYEKEFSKYNLVKNGNRYKLKMDFGELGRKFDQAQMALDRQVWIDVQQYMPLDTGNLKGQTNVLNNVIAGTGKVYMYPPESEYGHYQYEGIVYVDPVYQVGAFYSPEYGFWSRPGVAKVPSDRHLTYSQSRAEAHWGEAAYRDHAHEWYNVVRRVLQS